MTNTVNSDWRNAILNRRTTAVQRIGIGLATAMIVSPVLGAQFSLIWGAAYILVQLLELRVFAPVSEEPPRALGRSRCVVGGLVLVCNAGLYCAPAIPLWMVGGAMGGLTATVMLCAAVLYSTINASSSPRVLFCTVTPSFLVLAATPFLMIRLDAPGALVATVAASIVVFAIYCLVGWQSLTMARRKEERIRLDAELKQKSAEAEASRRSAYLASVAHDLRTPIGAILTGAAELDRSVMDGGARTQAALITDAGLMMKALLDDLLDHARLEAGGMSVEAADFNLRTVLAQTMRLWSGPIRAKGLDFRIEGTHQVPAMVRGDAMRLRQVLNNLLSNAVKFTDTGSITLRLRAWSEEPHGHAVLIEVADTGPGMKSSQLTRLFNPFDQTEDGVSARHGGSGLGLSISRNLVQLMGGRLVARSQPGEGATFTISVIFPPASDLTIRTTVLDAESRADVARALAKVTPVMSFASSQTSRTSVRSTQFDVPSDPRSEIRSGIVTPGEDAALPPSEDLPSSEASPEDTILATDPVHAQGTEDPDAEGEGRPLRALVVDDHDINRRAIELILVPFGCEIATAADGLAALELCANEPFDVIFMDVRMPELDGRETTRRLRAGAGPNVNVPVIAVTADTGEDDIAACMAAGMTYFVSKPLSPTALLGALQYVLSGDQGIEAPQISVAVA